MASVGRLVANTHIAVAVELRGARSVTIGVTSIFYGQNVLLVLDTDCDTRAGVFGFHCSIAELKRRLRPAA